MKHHPDCTRHDPNATTCMRQMGDQAWEAVPMPATGDTSDGYHTFNELYDHRMALTAAWFASLARFGPGDYPWRSRAHHPDDTPIYDGYFIVGVRLRDGWVTYHYAVEHWDLFTECETREHAPKYDGHTPADTVETMKRWAVGRFRDCGSGSLICRSPNGVLCDAHEQMP